MSSSWPGIVAALALLLSRSSDSIWTQFAPLLDPNSEIAVAGLSNRIYVMGGYPASRVYVDTVEVYNAADDSWSYSTPLPRAMHHVMAATVDGVLYVIGGEISDNGVANV